MTFSGVNCLRRICLTLNFSLPGRGIFSPLSWILLRGSGQQRKAWNSWSGLHGTMRQKVWVAESEDIPGLVTEAATQTQLIEKLKTMVPELLILNERQYDRSQPINLILKSSREQWISLAAA